MLRVATTFAMLCVLGLTLFVRLFWTSDYYVKTIRQAQRHELCKRYVGCRYYVDNKRKLSPQKLFVDECHGAKRCCADLLLSNNDTSAINNRNYSKTAYADDIFILSQNIALIGVVVHVVLYVTSVALKAYAKRLSQKKKIHVSPSSSSDICIKNRKMTNIVKFVCLSVNFVTFICLLTWLTLSLYTFFRREHIRYFRQCIQFLSSAFLWSLLYAVLVLDVCLFHLRLRGLCILGTLVNFAVFVIMLLAAVHLCYLMYLSR